MLLRGAQSIGRRIAPIHPFLSARAVNRPHIVVRTVKTAAGEELFDKILVANRGEITCRVIRTARRLGIKTVAVYSDADAHAQHVRMADEAVCVGPSPSSQSYLVIENILDAVKKTGAQAVHPGYGFLSENHNFQEALQRENVKFIGPGTEAITAMGDKIQSKRIAQDASVNTIPGFVGEVDSDEDVLRIAKEIGYPVMMKASAGGGGKGMRIAWSEKDALEGFRLSKEEAKSSFGDDRMLIEKYIEEPRHIEIQLVADQHGNILTLPERECSIQRRNQKVLEESPSVLLAPETRKAMQAQAANLARAVNYESAGTVEFLADKHQNFFFLEMNTRLQVEHPVSEFVSGVDLVEQMIRVASGYPLPAHLLEGDLPIQGHAMEARVYAEDPFRGFLPSIGTLSRYQEPRSRDPPSVAHPMKGVTDSPVRVDSGVTSGSEISMFYDPMISKLITHGSTRQESLERLRDALDEYVCRGVGHNIPFLRDVVAAPRYASGKITTNYIQEEYPDGFHGVQLTQSRRERMVAAAAVMQGILAAREASLAMQAGSGASSLSVMGEERWLEPVVVQFHGGVGAGEGEEDKADMSTPLSRVESQAWEVWMEGMGPSDVRPSGMDYTVRIRPFSAERARQEIAAAKALRKAPREHSAHAEDPVTAEAATQWTQAGVVELRGVEWDAHEPIFRALADSDLDADVDPERMQDADGVPGKHENVVIQHLERKPEGFALQYEGAQRVVTVRTREAQLLSQHMLPKPEVDHGKMLISPMPGTLVTLRVKEGDMVDEGAAVAVVEAMKMQNVLRAVKQGRVGKIHAQEGSVLATDDIIMEFEDV